MKLPEDSFFLPSMITRIILIAKGRARGLGIPVDCFDHSFWEDAFQDAVAALKAKPTGPELDEDTWPPYLAMTTMNCFRNIIRKRDNRADRQPIEQPAEEGGRQPNIPRTESTAEHALCNKERRRIMLESIHSFGRALCEKYGPWRQLSFTLHVCSKLDPEAIDFESVSSTLKSLVPEVPSRSTAYRDLEDFMGYVRVRAGGGSSDDDPEEGDESTEGDLD